MENPRAVGLPALILGMLTLGSSASAFLGASYAWTSLSGIANNGWFSDRSIEVTEPTTGPDISLAEQLTI